MRILSITFLITVITFAGFAQPGKDLDDLERIVGGARYVNFGEDSHFMTGVHRFVADSFQRLVEKKGFRVFVFESAWGVGDNLERFMASERTTLDAEESFFVNAFSSKSTTAMLIWIRDWNRRNPNDRIRIVGYQPEQPVTDFARIFETADKVSASESSRLRELAKPCRAGTGEFKTNLDFIISTSKRRRGDQPTFTSDERRGCNAALDEIERFIRANRKQIKRTVSPSAEVDVKLSVISLRTYLNVLTTALDEPLVKKDLTTDQRRQLINRLYSEGDRTRFEIFEALRKSRFPDKKVFFWMHNWHAMRNAPEVNAFGRDENDASMPTGTVSMGTRMSKAYGRRLVVIGNIVPKAVCKNPVCTPPPVRSDSLETPFFEKIGNGTALFDLRRPPDELRALPLAKSGSLYADINQGHFVDVVLARQFDAIFYLSETTATFEEK